MADNSTQPRLDLKKVNPELFNTMLGLEKYVQSSGLKHVDSTSFYLPFIFPLSSLYLPFIFHLSCKCLFPLAE